MSVNRRWLSSILRELRDYTLLIERSMMPARCPVTASRGTSPAIFRMQHTDFSRHGLECNGGDGSVVASSVTLKFPRCSAAETLLPLPKDWPVLHPHVVGILHHPFFR